MNDLAERACGILVRGDGAEARRTSRRRFLGALAAFAVVGCAVSVTSAAEEWKRLEVGNPGCIAISPDSKLLAVGLCVVPNKTYDSIQVWDLANRRLVKQLKAHESEVRAVVFSPDGKVLATAGDDKTIRLWEVATLNHIATLRGHDDRIDAVAFSPDGKWIVTGGCDRTLRVWNAATKKLYKTRDDVASMLNRIAYSPDGKRFLVTYDSKDGAVYDAETFAMRARLPHFKAFTHDLAYSPDGKQIALGLADGTVRLLRASDFAEQLKIDAQGYADNVAFSPDGKTIAVRGGGAQFALYRTDNGQRVRTLFDNRTRTDVMDIAFSPDGKTLAAAMCWDYDAPVQNDKVTPNGIALWDLSRGETKR
jgi:WD40 repeat protein